MSMFFRTSKEVFNNGFTTTIRSYAEERRKEWGVDVVEGETKNMLLFISLLKITYEESNYTYYINCSKELM